MKKSKMEASPKTIMSNSRTCSAKNKSTGGSKTSERAKVTFSTRAKESGGLQRSASKRNSSKQPLKSAQGGKHGSLQRQSSGRKNPSNGGLSDPKHIKEPKPRSNLKKKSSSFKKYEQEKQTLLIMEQMVSQVKDFTNKERYFDYKIISDTIASTECKRIWEAFKSRLRGQFREGNEEMRQCRNESNKDFWTHHYRSYPFRLDVYNKLLSHPEILEELRSMASNHGSEKNSKGNDLLDLHEYENKMIPVIEDFESTIKLAEGHEELDSLDSRIQDLCKELKEEEEKEEDDFKRNYKSKEGDRTLNRIMSRIYTDLGSEYEKKVFNPSEEQSFESKPASPKQDADKVSNENTDDTQKSKNLRGVRKEWSSVEIINLLMGIYQYGEPKWQEILSSYEFENKTAHDISVKWMDLRYQISNEQKKAENGSHKRAGANAFWKHGENKNGAYLRNGEIKEYSNSGKNWLVKSDKRILTLASNSKGGYNEIPILDNPSKSVSYYLGEEEDPEMRHYIEMINRNMPIFKIKKNASRDDSSDDDS